MKSTMWTRWVVCLWIFFCGYKTNMWQWLRLILVLCLLDVSWLGGTFLPHPVTGNLTGKLYSYKALVIFFIFFLKVCHFELNIKVLIERQSHKRSVHHKTCQSVSLSDRNVAKYIFCNALEIWEIAVREVACPSSDLGAYIYFMPRRSCEERLPALLLVYVESF